MGALAPFRHAHLTETKVEANDSFGKELRHVAQEFAQADKRTGISRVVRRKASSVSCGCLACFLSRLKAAQRLCPLRTSHKKTLL